MSPYFLLLLSACITAAAGGYPCHRESVFARFHQKGLRWFSIFVEMCAGKGGVWEMLGLWSYSG